MKTKQGLILALTLTMLVQTAWLTACNIPNSTPEPLATHILQPASTEAVETTPAIAPSPTLSPITAINTPAQIPPTQESSANICLSNWFFTFNNEHASLGTYCPQPVQLLEAAGQDFEGGRAYRYDPDPSYTIDQRGTVFIIYNDGEWVTFPDNWDASQPSSDPELTVPDGRYQPIESIGKIWRENADVRNRLGWAYEPQSRFQGRIQYYLVQPGTPSGDTHFFFIDHGARGAVLLLNSVDMGPNKWEVAGSYK